MNRRATNARRNEEYTKKTFFLRAPSSLRAFVALLFFSSFACTTPHGGAPVVAKVHRDDMKSRIQFQRQITERKICTNDDAFHLLIAYSNQSDPCEGYDQR